MLGGVTSGPDTPYGGNPLCDATEIIVEMSLYLSG